MQLATDTAAHAALYTWEFEDEQASTTAALATITDMLPDIAYRDALLGSDIEYGFYDPDLGTFTVDPTFVEAYRAVLQDQDADRRLVAQALALPGEEYLAELAEEVEPAAIHEARQFVRRTLARELRTLLLDVKKRTWCQPLLDKLEIDKALLPEVFESEVVSGTLSDVAASALGLPSGVAVVGGGGDQAAGAVGNGIVSGGTISATMGTSGVVFAHSDEVQTDPEGRVHTFCHAVHGQWHVMGCVLSAGGSLQWYRNQFGEMETAIAAGQNTEAYELMTTAAAMNLKSVLMPQKMVPSARAGVTARKQLRRRAIQHSVMRAKAW